ncbi:hypothetical protein AB4Y45_33640 [Paraburkholderia sp. EG287A]|uniref:hypothetical protein n=1 Tax=Paraburkholderia sp. EG287A TaxID=3237012 RepID=UPI0034D2AB56
MSFDPTIINLRNFAQNEMGSDLSTYSARGAIHELLESWEAALADGNKAQLAGDVDLVIEQLQKFKLKALALLPIANGGLEGKTLEEWKEKLAAIGVKVYRSGFEFRNTSGFRFTGMNGGDYAEEHGAVIAAVKRYLPEGGYAFTPLQLARARIHSLATPLVGTGWLLLADSNTFGNVIYLVSQLRDISLAYECDKPYHDFMRQKAFAELYASEHPEKPNTVVAASAELVITPLAV